MLFCAIPLHSYSARIYFRSNLPFIENSIPPRQKNPHEVNTELFTNALRLYHMYHSNPVCGSSGISDTFKFLWLLTDTFCGFLVYYSVCFKNF